MIRALGHLHLLNVSSWVKKNISMRISSICVTAVVCMVLACGDPGVPEHGNRVGPTNFTAGALVSYSCDSDYYLLGQSESTCYCLPNTCQWLPSRPVCTKGNQTMKLYLHCTVDGHA